MAVSLEREPGTCDITKQGLHVDLSRCVHARHRSASCDRCARICPAGAITIQDALALDLDRCTGCGLCATRCPTGALEAVAPSLPELVLLTEERARSAKSVAFGCAQRAGQAPDAIQVPCIGRIDEAILLTAAASGAESIAFHDGECETCTARCGRELTSAAIEEANQLLRNLGHAPLQLSRSASPSPEVKPPPPAPPTVSRRALFTLLRGSRPLGPKPTPLGTADTDRWLCRPPEETPTAPHLPARQQALHARLAELSRGTKRRFLSSALFAEPQASSDCRCCTICSELCPTGALSRTMVRDELRLTLDASRCTGCGLCAESCCWSAIHVGHDVDLPALLDTTPRTLSFRRHSGVDPIEATMEDKLSILLGLDHLGR